MSALGRVMGLSGSRASTAVAVAPPPGNDTPPKAGSGSVWYSTPGMPQIPEWDGLTAIRNGYQASIYIMQPVRTIATALGSLPIRFGADMNKPADYDIAAHGARLLGPAPCGPNPATSTRNLIIWSLIQRLITGRMAWETVCPPGSKAPGAIWPLVAPFLDPIPSKPGSVRWFDGFEYRLPTGVIPMRADQVFYSWRAGQVDFRQPESALMAAAMPTSLLIALDRYMWALAKNGLSARKLVISPDFELDDERRAWEEQFASEYTGYDNGGRVMHGYYEDDDTPKNMSSAGKSAPPIQVIDLATTPVDADIIEILHEVKADLLRTWRVPLSWLGDSSARTYENASQEAKNFWDGPVLELAAEVVDDVNQYLSPRFGDSNVGWFDFSGVEALRAGSNVFAPVAPDAAVAANLATVDDWRNDVGLPPMDPADKPVQSLPAIDDSPGGNNSKTNFARSTDTAFKTGTVPASAVLDLLEHAYPGSVLDWVKDATWKYDPGVPLDEIKMARRPGGRDQTKVDGIAQAVKDGQTMDPVVLVDTGEGKLEIADGYHRTLAFDRVGKRTIPALVGTVDTTTGPWQKDMHDAKLNRAADAAGLRYDESPIGTGKNWVTSVGGLPLFIRAIAHALIRDGKSESEAIQLAVGVVKNWAAGKGKVSAKTRAKAAAAVAEWEAKKGASHASPSKRDTLVEAGTSGLLLPKGNPARLVVAAHAFQLSPTNRRKCKECGKGVTAAAHGLVARTGSRQVTAGARGSRRHMRAGVRRLVKEHAAVLEPQLAEAMAGVFAKQRKAVMSRLTGRRGAAMLTRAATPPPEGGQGAAGPVDAAAVFDMAHWADETQAALNPVFATIRTLTTQRLAEQITPGQPVFPAAVGVARTALADRVSKLADQVTRETYDQIQGAIADGITAGEGIRPIADRVQAVFDNADHVRAERIARTEVMSAVNTAQDAYATALPAGIVGEKEWLATPDSRTREAHAEANGQTRPIGEPFMVGGFPMQHPGDMTSAPPSDFVNCRCTTLYVPAPKRG